jgi:uncharacterized protein
VRTVVDTTVIVSALLLPMSIPRQAIDAAASRGKLLISSSTAAELDNVLRRPKFNRYVSEEERLEFFAALVREAEEVEVNEVITECRDPKDNKFPELAICGDASHILSGKVKGESEPVNEEFLRHIESLPVIRNGGIPRKSKKKIDVGQSKVWLIATRNLSDRLAKAEEAFEQAGTEDAQKHINTEGYEVSPIRWSGKSRFRSEAKPGDLASEVFTEKRGKRKYVEVYEAAPIIGVRPQRHSPFICPRLS